MTSIVRLTIGFALGLVVGLRVGDPDVAGLAAGGALIAVYLAVATRTRTWFPVVALAAGVLHGTGTAVGAIADCRAALPEGATLHGRVHIHSRGAAGQVVAGRFEELTLDGLETSCAGEIRLRLPRRFAQPHAFHLRVTGTWWANPERGNWPTHPSHRGVLGVKAAAPDTVDHHHPVTWLRAAAIDVLGVVFAKERPLAESLLLAHRENLDPDVRQNFAAAGIAHMLAISGAHVGILAAALLLLMRLFGAGARLAPSCTAACTVAYVLFLGAPAAASRAALQVVLLLATRIVQRPAEPLSLLSVAAVSLLVARPLSLLEPGFQLSFAGVFGLIAFRRPLAALVPARVPEPIAGTLTATLAASLSTAPIAAWHFGIVSLIAPLTNLLAVPLVAFALPASALALAAGTVSRDAGAFLGGGASVFLGGLRVLAEAAARPAWGHRWVTSGAVTAAIAGSAVAFRFGPAPSVPAGLRPAALRHAVRKRHLYRAGMAAAAAAAILSFGSIGNGALEIHAIDVGQGDAIAIRTPRGRWILVDAGPRFGGFDAGRQRVAPYLLDRGVTRIEVLVLTHPDTDHVGGAPWLWRAFDIGAVIDPALPAGKGPYLDALRVARRGDTPWFAARAGRELWVDGVEIRFLGPSDSLVDHSRNANDLSAVVRIGYGAFGALLLGDASRGIENRLVEHNGPGIRSELIKVGHHGSRTSTGDSLLATVRPAVALISVGRRNRYGHPADEVVERLADRGVRILRTDEGGSIEVRVRPDARMEVRRRQ